MHCKRSKSFRASYRISQQRGFFQSNCKRSVSQRLSSQRCTLSQRVAIIVTSALLVASGLSTSTLAEAKEKLSSFANDSLGTITSTIAQNVGSAVGAAANTAGSAVTTVASTIADSTSSFLATVANDLGDLQGGGGVHFMCEFESQCCF